MTKQGGPIPVSTCKHSHISIAYVSTSVLLWTILTSHNTKNTTQKTPDLSGGGWDNGDDTWGDTTQHSFFIILQDKK